jgi:hypothetical protein
VSSIISLPLVYFVLGSASNALFLFGLTNENSRNNMFKLIFAVIGIAFYIWAIKN